MEKIVINLTNPINRLSIENSEDIENTKEGDKEIRWFKITKN